MATISENIIRDLGAYAVGKGTFPGPATSYEGKLPSAKAEPQPMKFCQGCGRLLPAAEFDPESMGNPGALCRGCAPKGRRCPRCGGYKLPSRFASGRECRDCRSTYFQGAKARAKAKGKDKDKET